MKNKHVKLIGLLSAAMLVLSPLGGILAADTASDPALISAPAPEAQSPETAAKPAVSYDSFAGKVAGVTEGTPQIVTLENEEGGRAEFAVSSDTYRFDGVEFTEGSQIAGYYDASLPMTLQYPPRYAAAVVAPVTNEYGVFVGLFDDKLVSQDGQLALLNTEVSEIVDVHGESYTGALTGRRLAIAYKIVTASLPGQTTPSKVVVLPEPVLTPPAEQPQLIPTDVSQLTVVINQVETPIVPYANAGGVIMLPLRAAAEAAGFDVTWDPAQRVAEIGRIITVTADRDYYVYARTAPIELGVAPEIIEGRIYVPFSFFLEVARFDTAEVTGGKIVLNNAVSEAAVPSEQRADTATP
jgi:hypothetical protein